MDVASPPQARTDDRQTPAVAPGTAFAANDLATKFFGADAASSTGPSGPRLPQAQGEGATP